MLENLSLALQITLIGMGLVFASIVLLWGLMALLVRIGPEAARKPAEETSQEQEYRRKAAAAAVAAALARERSEEPRLFPLPPTASVSPWQSVMRTKMLNKRGSVR